MSKYKKNRNDMKKAPALGTRNGSLQQVNKETVVSKGTFTNPPFRSLPSSFQRKSGLHLVDFFVATRGGMTIEVGNKLLLDERVISASRSIGPHAIDLRVETVLRGNEDILLMLERIKGIDGVSDAVWSEIV